MMVWVREVCFIGPGLDWERSMNLEIEAKMKLDDPAALMARLLDAYGPASFEVVQRDSFFDTTDDQLRHEDAGLRLRVVHPVHEPEAAEAIITYKGARQDGELKRREEVELSVGDPAHAARLLKRLGYTERISVEKRRTTWRIDSCAVEIDQVPYLGHFVEIEGPDESAVMAMRTELGLDECPLIRDGYVQLLAAYLAENGIDETCVGFEPAPAG